MLNRSTEVNVLVQPHDATDAARLYGQMLDKARAEVKDAMVLQFGAHNELTGILVEPMRNFATDQLSVRLLFKLNGHLYDFAVEDVDKIADEAMTVVAQHLVSQILNKLFRNGKRP